MRTDYEPVTSRLFYETPLVLKATLLSCFDCLSYLMQCFNALWILNHETRSFGVTICVKGNKYFQWFKF
jgi:hypothetical protein